MRKHFTVQKATIDAPDRRLLFLDPVEPWRESVTRMGTSFGDRC